jgi:MFS family permease
MIALGLALVIVGMGTMILAVELDPGRSVGFATAAPLLLAGLGSGLVISPNVTLTLDEVPVSRAGIAGGVLQTGQRIGSAAGIALVGAVFFARLAAGGDWAHAFSVAMGTAAGLTLVALALAVADLHGMRRKSVRAAQADAVDARTE